MMPPIAGVATSQTADNSAVISQSQTGNVDASQTLDVVTQSEETSATTTATGNSATAASDVGSLDVQQAQSMQGAAGATTILNVETEGNAGEVGLVTAATGNTAEADSLGGAPLTGNLQQSAGPGAITAESQVNAAEGQANDLVANAQAIANTQGVAVDGSTSTVSVTQSSSATAQSNGGGVVGFVPGEADFTASAVSNNVTATGLDGASQTLTLNQSVTGPMTQAADFVAAGQAQSLNNAATASANNISVSNDGGPLDVVAVQNNQGYVRGQAESTAYAFGTSSAAANGVGNSAIYGETGGQITLNSAQFNSGAGVEAVASSGGSVGYDLSSSATAMGNAVTGYACSACGGVMNITSGQVNTADVGARSSIPYAGDAGPVRSAISTATAVGNSATFYVSRPSN
jgi:hypothetical protein